ncbi:MAG: polysaccharide deacetylase family protein [Proteobacteria bacterium]|nr:polysaccharide deacetylase family protein [Pseudomonadota bacterium]
MKIDQLTGLKLTPPDPARQCWADEALKTHPGEELVRKGIPAAYRPPPERQLSPRPSKSEDNVKVIRRVDLPPGVKLVALTFDLCEQPYEIAGYQGAIVDFLRDQKIRATFFAGGKWMLSHLDRAQQLMTDPLFEVANHTWEHRNLRIITGKKLNDEIQNAERAYEEVRSNLGNSCSMPELGEALKQRVPEHMSLFRFPFGACNPESLRAVADAGLTPVQWDVSSGDPTPAKPEVYVRQVVDNTKPGSIILFHANGRGHATVALSAIARELKARGYEFATVTDLLNVEGAKPVLTDTCFDSKLGDTNRYDTLSRQLEVAFERFSKEQIGKRGVGKGPTR